MQEMTIDPNSQNLFLEEVYEVLMKAKNDSEM